MAQAPLSIQYSSFEAGISDDDYIAPKGTYIEGENVTGLFTGYGITLGPKISNQLRTNYMPRTIFGQETTVVFGTRIAVGTDHGEIYKINGTDNTPIHTLSNNYDILNGAVLGSYMYFFSKIPTTGSTTCKTMQVLSSDFDNETFTSADEGFLDFNNIGTPPVLVTGTYIFVGGLNTVYRINSAGSIDTFAIFNGYVTGISVHGTQLQIYTNTGYVSYWDGEIQGVSANIPLGFIPTRVTSQGGFDNILNDDGDYYIGSGYQFQLASKVKSSARLSDNTQYIDKLNFNVEFITGQALAPARDGLYMISSDTVPGIYERNYLVTGLPVGFNKVATRDSDGNQFDELGTLTYLTKGSTVSKLFFGYQSDTINFGVDYIDLNTNTTCEDGYLVTTIFRGPPGKILKMGKIRVTTSYTSGDNYIKLYKRINNGSWTLFRTINNATNTIERLLIENQSNEFVDIQFKIELHNDLMTDFPPILHDLELEYSINKD